MTSGFDRDPPLPQQSLVALARSVREARAVVRQCRHVPVVPAELVQARRALIAALTEYTEALERRQLPVAHELRSELEMHRSLFD